MGISRCWLPALFSDTETEECREKNLTEVTEFIFLGFSTFHEQQITLFMVFLILYITLGWQCHHCEHHPHWSSPPHSQALLPKNAGQFKGHIHTGHNSTHALWPRSPEPTNLPGRLYHSNILLSYLNRQQLLSAHGEGVWPLRGHLQPFEIHTHHEQDHLDGVHPTDEWRLQHWLGHGSCPISIFTLPFHRRVVGHFFCDTLPVIKFSCIERMRSSILLSVCLWSWLSWAWASPPIFSSSPPSSRSPQPKARSWPLPPAPPTSLWSLSTMAVPPLPTSSPSQRTARMRISWSQWPTLSSPHYWTLWCTPWGVMRPRMPCAELSAETFLNPSTLFIKNSMCSWCIQPQVCPVQSVL